MGSRGLCPFASCRCRQVDGKTGSWPIYVTIQEMII